MTGQRLFRHWCMLFALVAMWGSSFLFTKIALAVFMPLDVVAGRLAIAAVVLSITVVLMGRPFPNTPHLWGVCALMALVGNALPFWLISWGQQFIPSGVAGILMAIMPLMTLFLAHTFVGGAERLTTVRVAGFVVGFVGIVVLMGENAASWLSRVISDGAAINGTGGPPVLLAELAVIGGALCYAVNTIIARRRPVADPITVAAGVAISASCALVPLAASLGDHTIAPNLGSHTVTLAFAAVGFLGIVSTGVATVVYFRLIAEAGPSFLSLINYLIPIWAVTLGVILLEEPLEWRMIVALALVSGGIGLSEWRRPRL